MPTITFSIGGPQIDISGKSSEQVLDLVKKEYNKKVEEKKVVEEEEEEQELVDCDFCGVKEDPDEIIKGTEGKACGSCRHLCDKEEEEAYYCYKCNIVLDDTANAWVMDTVGYRCFVCKEKEVDSNSKIEKTILKHLSSMINDYAKKQGCPF